MSHAYVLFDDATLPPETLKLHPRRNLRTGEVDLQKVFGELTSLEIDLLVLASSIFACDLAFKRGVAENITRQIELTVPVVNLARFNQVSNEIHYVLYKLSHDAWRINFVQKDGALETSIDWQNDNDGKILLFSGGLDSFAASILLGDRGEQVRLISHITANQAISSAQEQLFEYLNQQYIGQFSRTPVRVGGISKSSQGYPFPSDQKREETQRTRSFLFLSLAGLAARRLGISDIIMIAENGQLAIHLPLTSARVSAFSTHTAHPEFVYRMSEIISNLLNYQITIENPFLYMTKAEAVRLTIIQHLNMAQETVSCWMSSRIRGDKKHCGYCIPCLIRRIAIEANGVQLNEYRRDLLSENIAQLNVIDEGKRNFIELAEFVRSFESMVSQAEIEYTYPELRNPYIDANKAVDMYHRFAVEARAVMNNYSNLNVLVQ